MLKQNSLNFRVKEARRQAASGEGPPVLYLNAGDTYTGTAWFTIYKWKVAAEFLNALQPDAVVSFDHFINSIIIVLAVCVCYRLYLQHGRKTIKINFPSQPFSVKKLLVK